MEEEEERRRERKKQKKEKKERKERAANQESGNIGYFVMRAPSALDISNQEQVIVADTTSGDRKKEKKERKERAGNQDTSNNGYFVMRTPSVLDNSKQEDDAFRNHLEDPIEPQVRRSSFEQSIQAASLDRTSFEGGTKRPDPRSRQEAVVLESSSEDDTGQFHDSLSTPHTKDKSMGVPSLAFFLYLLSNVYSAPVILRWLPLCAKAGAGDNQLLDSGPGGRQANGLLCFWRT